MIIFRVILFILASICMYKVIYEEDFESLYFAILFYVVAIWLQKIGV